MKHIRFKWQIYFYIHPNSPPDRSAHLPTSALCLVRGDWAGFSTQFTCGLPHQNQNQSTICMFGYWVYWNIKHVLWYAYVEKNDHDLNINSVRLYQVRGCEVKWWSPIVAAIFTLEMGCIEINSVVYTRHECTMCCDTTVFHNYTPTEMAPATILSSDLGNVAKETHCSKCYVMVTLM